MNFIFYLRNEGDGLHEVNRSCRESPIWFDWHCGNHQFLLTVRDVTLMSKLRPRGLIFIQKTCLSMISVNFKAQILWVYLVSLALASKVANMSSSQQQKFTKSQSISTTQQTVKSTHHLKQAFLFNPKSQITFGNVKKKLFLKETELSVLRSSKNIPAKLRNIFSVRLWADLGFLTTKL